jgi:hypothetical protein
MRIEQYFQRPAPQPTEKQTYCPNRSMTGCARCFYNNVCTYAIKKDGVEE